jgi:hypothetical protein
MPQKKVENTLGGSPGSQPIDDSMEGMRARVKVLETKLENFDQMAARFATLERDLAVWKNETAGEVVKLVEEKTNAHQAALVGQLGAADDLQELDRKVQELDKGLRTLDQCVVKCTRNYTQLEKEHRQNLAHLQVNLKDKVREMFAKVDVCASRNEIKMAMKSVQFDMLNHSNACRSLARAVSDIKKNIDVKSDPDDAIEQILRWDSANGATKCNGTADDIHIENGIQKLPLEDASTRSRLSTDALSAVSSEPIPPPPGPPPDGPLVRAL